MVPERGGALDLQKLSHLEVEPLEVIICTPESERVRSLDALTTIPGEVEIAALLTGTLPVNDGCCCCCCPSCCCC